MKNFKMFAKNSIGMSCICGKDGSVKGVQRKIVE